MISEYIMALDRHQSSLATFQPHASLKFSTGNNESGVWPFCMPGASVQKQDTASFVSWSTGAEDGSYCLMNGVQNGWISRKPTTLIDSDGEADLQGLVSNILDEAVSQNGCNRRALLASNSIWAPKSVDDELHQGFQSPSKTQHITAFHPNPASPVTSNAANTDDIQQAKEPVISQQWIFNVPMVDKDYLPYRPTKLPPGLSVPNTDNAYQSYIQKESTTVNEKRGNQNYLDSFPDLSNVFNPQSEASTPYFHPNSEANIYDNVKPISNQQYDSQDLSQLVTGFQSLMASEHDVSFHGNFADVYRETQSKHDEGWRGEHRKFTRPSMPTPFSPAVQTAKEQVGVQMERNGLMRNEMVNCEDIQNLHGFTTQSTEPFQQPKIFSGSVSLANHQTKMTMQEKSNLLPFNLKNNQCLNQQEHIQSKIKSQMQKEKKKTFSILGENLYTSHISKCSTKGQEKNQQNLEHFEIMQSPRFGGENGRGSAKGGQQPICVYPVNDPKTHWSMNSPNYHSRSTLSYGNPDPSVCMGNMTSADEFTTLKAFVNNLMTQRGDPTYHGLHAAMTSITMDDVPLVQLYLYLDECCEQLRCLEKERKKTEIILTKTSQGGKTTANTSTLLPKMPPNPTRIDHLIVNQMKEQAKVASVLHRMESLNSFLHINIHTALKKHYLAISVAEARCKEDIAIVSKHKQPKDYFAGYKDTLLMVMALKDLAATTRRLRTALWCALQMVLPKPVVSQDQAKGTARCPSPYEGGAFKL